MTPGDVRIREMDAESGRGGGGAGVVGAGNPNEVSTGVGA
jgi:hypothetical protein